MFDIGLPEMAIIVIIAIVVIGPKELPRALATAGRWMGKARGVMANFRTGLDAMVRESELQEMEKKWAAENQKIMLEHPGVDGESAADDGPQMEPTDAEPSEETPEPPGPADTDKPAS